MLGLLAAIILHQQETITVKQSAYDPILAVIAKGESNGNYNAYYANADNQSIRFTNLTIEKVMQWQDEHVSKGHPSNAVGKYQIVRPTLAGLVKQLKLDPRTVYDEAVQDRLAIALLERRGALAFAEDKISREQFAANLAKEWAALPRILGGNPKESYYAGDGLNHSRVSPEEILDAVQNFKTSATTP